MMVHIPIKTVSEANRRDRPMRIPGGQWIPGWDVKRRRTKEHRYVSALCIANAHIHLEPAPFTVTMTRITPSSRMLDDDNLRSALKAARDGIADAFGIDDGDPRVTWEYAQRKGKPREYAVEVEFKCATTRY